MHCLRASGYISSWGGGCRRVEDRVQLPRNDLRGLYAENMVCLGRTGNIFKLRYQNRDISNQSGWLDAGRKNLRGI